MPARGAFQGLRLDFLLAELDGYATAVAQGTKDEFTKDVLRRYFKRFPPDLDHDKEPSEALK